MGHIDKASCSASHQLGMLCNSEKISKKDLFLDTFGFYWCRQHEMRGKLLNWAQAHLFPCLAFTSQSTNKHYIIGNNAKDVDLWKVAMVCGNEDSIESCTQHIWSLEDNAQN